jgi:hypothetical protein
LQEVEWELFQGHLSNVRGVEGSTSTARAKRNVACRDATI